MRLSGSGFGFLLGVPVIGGLFTLVAVVILARVGGRLLGIRLRWRRAIVAGFAGLALGWVAAWSINGRRHGPRGLPWPGVLFGALIATMLLAVTLELLARPGRLAAVESRLRASPLPHPLRSLRQRAGRSRRYLQVTRIAARHGLSSYLGGRRPGAGEPPPLAGNLRAALEEAGGMFVKLGQVLSTRADLLPADVIAELSRLQDHVAPTDPAGIEALLTAELGAPPQAVFASFDPVPVAAASIGQAHRAQLATGEPVIVKVQRPQVRALVERDLDILLRVAAALEARAGWARQYAVLAMTRGFAAALREELDFRTEARNIAAVASSPGVRVPAVYPRWSTSRVLVMEHLDGVAVRDAGPVLAGSGADRHGLARRLLTTILRQVMAEGTFHADPHPGNVLLLRGGQLALIDFGSVGRLDPLQQAGLRRLLLAVARRNPAELHDSLLDLAHATQPAATGENLLEPALAQFLAQHLGPAMVPGAAMFTTLFRLLAEFGLVFPPVIAGVFRAMITLEGTLVRLDPGFQIVEETQKLSASWLGDTLSPASLRDAAADEVLGLLPVLRRLPRRLDRITTSLERGTLTTSVRLLADDRDRHFIASMAGRAVLAFLGAAFGIMSVMLLGVHGGPLLLPTATGTGGTSLFHVFGYAGLFFSLVLTLRVIIAITREGIAWPPMRPEEIIPRGQDFATVGHLYRSIERGLAHLADKLGADRLFIGPAFWQADETTFGWPDLRPITDLAGANRAIERIVEQGEGARGDWANAHYGRFLQVLGEYLAMRQDDPGFEPAHPVVAAAMRDVEGIEPDVYISDPATGECSDLFNAVYELLLQMIARYFAFGHETPEQRQVLAQAAVGLMFQAVKPLGLLLARLPVGPDHPDVTAGANFQLPYRASFLLPHRRSAWLRFAERLDELANFAHGLHPPAGADEVVAVAAALRRTAANLTAHVETV